MPTVDGDELATLYDDHAATIARYLHRRLGPAHVEDAVADVFLRAVRGAPGYVALHDTPLPWLFGIASHVVADARRTERRRLRALQRMAEARGASLDAQEGPAEGLDPRVVAALRRLGTMDRETVLLAAWGELSYEEISIALGIPIGTVRSRINRARKRLAPLLSDTELPLPRPTLPEDVPHA